MCSIMQIDSSFGRLAAVADPQGGLFKIIEPPKQ